MAKITKHDGPSDAVTGMGDPARRPPSPAEMLRARGKLGPYEQPEGEETPERQVQPEPPHTFVPDDSAETEETEEAEGEVLDQPARNASRDAWVTYVEALTNEDVPEDTTRAELIEMYGTPPEG